MNVFFKSQFSNCPLVLMCSDGSLSTKLNRLFERCLQKAYSDKNLIFNEILKKDGSVSIYHQSLQRLADEILKVSRGLSSEIIDEIFQFREERTYVLKQRSKFHIPSVHSVFSGTESLKFLGPNIWTLVPNEIKVLESLDKF